MARRWHSNGYFLCARGVLSRVYFSGRDRARHLRHFARRQSRAALAVTTRCFPRATLHGGDAAFEQRIAQIIGFVEAPAIGLDLPLDIRGTAFQQRVWQALRAIPPGQTVSYSTLAAAIGSPRAVRAVASACAANTLAVAIPCHRVIRRDGSLSGYRWGLERKRELLAREHSESP